MARAFRFEPPRGRGDLVTRPRLLQVLLGRWEHRVVTVVGGPGLGKTTLLVQAMAENALAPRGEDVWIGLEPADRDRENLAAAFAAALSVPRPSGGERTSRPSGGERTAATDPGSVADALWRRSPAEVCVVLDDVHLLGEGDESGGAAWLQELVEALPDNGHLVVASRAEPPLRLARLWMQGQVAALDEETLRFSDDELRQFAARRGVDTARLAPTAGWPAMAEAAASVEHPADPHAFVWEEVLEPLGAERRGVLALVSDLGGADDALAAAAAGTPVDLDAALAGVPLVAVGPDGWRVPHPLWRGVPGLALAEGEGRAARSRAVHHLVERGRTEEAFALLSGAGLWELASDVLRSASVAGNRPTAEQLDRWLAALPPDAHDSVGGRLAVGLLCAFRSPADAAEPLAQAIAACRGAGDAPGELAALAEQGRIAWWRQDIAGLAVAAGRVEELAAEGYPLAQGLAAFGRAIAADAMGHDHDRVLAMLDEIPAGVLDPGWEASARWLRTQLLLARGLPAEALEVIEATDPGDDQALRSVVAGVRLGALWGVGRIEEVLAAMSDIVEDDQTGGVAHNRRLMLLSAAAISAAVGDADAARRCIDATGDVSLRTANAGVLETFAVVALLLAEGDEARAAEQLRAEVERAGTNQGIGRRQWRSGLVTSYVLVPEVREVWEAADLGGYHQMALTLAQAVVAARSDPPDVAVLAALDLPEVPLVRSALHVRFAADLAVGLTAAGRSEGEALLDALGPPGREAVRAVANGPSGQSKAARTLLAALPAPPATTTYVGVLGSLVVERGSAGRRPSGGERTVRAVVDPADPDLRRERVRALLAFLVSHRSTTRAACVAALWPDLDERSAANNLRVTLTYLLRVLEPERSSGEPSFHIRLDGQRVQLVASDRLVLDVDQFDEHLAAAARAEAHGSPSVALDHQLEAVALYRGDLHADLSDAAWLDLDREHYRSRFVTTAVRAGELLVGRGDPERAEAVARRALTVDPWAEEAHAVLVAAALGRGDRSAARRALERCTAALAELGMEPSEATRRLIRRARS